MNDQNNQNNQNNVEHNPCYCDALDIIGHLIDNSKLSDKGLAILNNVAWYLIKVIQSN